MRKKLPQLLPLPSLLGLGWRVVGKLPRSSFRHRGSGLNTPTWDPHAMEDQSPWQRGRCPDGAATALRVPCFWVVTHLDRGWKPICDWQSSPDFRSLSTNGVKTGSSKLSLTQPQSTERLGSLRQGDGCSPGGRQAGSFTWTSPYGEASTSRFLTLETDMHAQQPRPFQRDNGGTAF